MTQTMTQRLAAHNVALTYDDLPPEVQRKAKVLLIHGVGMALAGHDTEYARIAAAVAADDGSPAAGGARVLVDGTRCSVPNAVVANAAMLHARTQEDALGPIHLGPVAIPLVLALGEQVGASGRQVLEAVVAAYETTAAVSDGVAEKATELGFRPTPLFGVLAAAAAAAKLLGLPVERHAAALGYAATFSAGTLEPAHAKTMEWRFQPGHAAVSGLMAARLAAQGASAAPEAIEGRYGFYRAFLRHESKGDELDALGRRFRMLDVLLKPCPGCVYAIPAAIATAELVKRHGLAADDIVSVDGELPEYDLNYPGMDSRGPFAHPQQAAGSVYYALALAQVEGAVRLSGMARIEDPVVLGAIDKVHLRSEPARRGMTARITITTATGATHSNEVDGQQRYSSLGIAEARELGRDLYDEMPLPPEQLDEAFGLLEELDTAESLDRPMAALMRHKEQAQ